ncbi:PilW family protein [Propionivibrio dicarboxylicus]|uniref:Type IV pilus assembly protein PilW n=1 Tax=Propionivibrio dicarboxylicus TaxID=83767 RepID=A0A1G7ZNH5_9RHOO|nr:PilW family protein [Propionivibrio dicarboxylicus]SDH10116.1 type IV pilus assembly protein PilW [Propionivibrio dicarboxylicus]
MRRRFRFAQQGVSLVELMVGVTIGLITALLMAQFALFYDAQKKGNSGSAEAQSSGAIAMYSLETDIRLGGYGLAALDAFYCTLQSSRSFNGRRYMPVMIIPDGTAAGAATNPLGIPPGDAGSDIIAVMYGNTIATPEGVPISGVSGTTTYSFGKNVTGFNLGDFVLVAQAGQNCTVGQITAVANPSITVDQASTGATYAANTTNVFNLGAGGMVMRVYAIRSGNLTVCDFWTTNCADASRVSDTTVWVPIASNIVGLRAQYGWDTTATPDMHVDAYCRSHLTVAAPTCPSPDAGATVPSIACDWTRIATLRVALVSRSAEIARDGANVSPATITLWPSVVANVSGVPLTAGPVFTVPSQRYRYKVFETIVPVRNVVWLGGQSGC